MRLFVVGHVPLELHAVGARKRIDLEAAGEPERGVDLAALLGVDAWPVLARDLDAFDLGLPHRGALAGALDHAFRAALLVHHHALPAGGVAWQRQRAAR